MMAATAAHIHAPQLLFFEQFLHAQHDNQITKEHPAYAQNVAQCEHRLSTYSNATIASAVPSPMTAAAVWSLKLELTARCVHYAHENQIVILMLPDRLNSGWEVGQHFQLVTVSSVTSQIIESAQVGDMLTQPSSTDVARAYSTRAYDSLMESRKCRSYQLNKALTLLCEALLDAAMAAARGLVSEAMLAVAFAFVDTTTRMSLDWERLETHPGMFLLMDTQRKNEGCSEYCKKYVRLCFFMGRARNTLKTYLLCRTLHLSSKPPCGTTKLPRV